MKLISGLVTVARKDTFEKVSAFSESVFGIRNLRHFDPFGKIDSNKKLVSVVTR